MVIIQPERKDELLTDENFLLYAAKHYQSKLVASTAEFKDDINRIRYIKKLLTRFETTKELKERLILNHIIVLNNMFGPYHCSRIMFLKFHKQFELIKPFLEYLYILPLHFYDVGSVRSIYDTRKCISDKTIVEALKAL